MKLFLIAVAVLMCPLIGNSQISMHQLPKDTSAFGLGLEFREDNTTISGGLEYGIDSFTKGYFYGAIGFYDAISIGDNDYVVGDIPPAPEGGLGVVYVAPLSNTGFESYVSVGGAAAFARVVEGNRKITSTRGLGVRGTVGLLKRLNTKSTLKLTPFFGVSYDHIWTTTDVWWVDESKTEGDGSVGGLLGLGSYLSPSLLLTGVFNFSFETSDTNFNMTVTFY